MTTRVAKTDGRTRAVTIITVAEAAREVARRWPREWTAHAARDRLATEGLAIVAPDGTTYELWRTW